MFRSNFLYNDRKLLFLFSFFLFLFFFNQVRRRRRDTRPSILFLDLTAHPVARALPAEYGIV